MVCFVNLIELSIKKENDANTWFMCKFVRKTLSNECIIHFGHQAYAYICNQIRL